MNRDKKLALLKKRDAIKNLKLTGDGEAFIDILEATVNELKDSVGGGIDLNADDLLEQLSQVSALKENVDNLKKSIDSLNIPEVPDYIKIDGLETLVQATKVLANKKQELPDPQPLVDIKKAIVDLTLKVEEQKVPDQGQQPGDYVPMRRVVLVGKKLMWDDSFYTGGGGGGTNIPLKNGSVPVVNPDGSNVGGSSGSTNITQLGGNTIDTNSGTKSAGTQRIVIATDQPTMTNAQPVTLASTTITGTVVVDDLAAAPTGAAVPANAQYQGNLAQTALPTAATAGNLVGALADKFGRTVTSGSIRDLKGEQVTTITSSTAETTIVTQVASTFIDVYGLIMTNSSATATKVTVRDATAGGTARVYYVPAGDMRGFMLPESGAVKQGTVNNNWTATCGTSVASLDVQVLYVLNK